MEPQHVFERAGLGKPKYEYLGNERAPEPTRNGLALLYVDEEGLEHWGKPGWSCHHCSQYILTRFRFRSACGKTFHVGRDCFEKAFPKSRSAEKILSKFDQDCRKVRATRRKEREVARIREASVAITTNEALQEELRAAAHSKSWAAAEGLTKLDEVRWFFANAGHAGKLKMARLVESLLKEATADVDK